MSGQRMQAEPTDRPSSVDDMATQREAEFTAAALAASRTGGVVGTPGVCLNCAARLASLAVYCDADCRADHEHRVSLGRRVRGAG